MDCYAVVEFKSNSKGRTEADVVPKCCLFEEAALDESIKHKCYWPDKEINVKTKVKRLEKAETAWPT